jgi:hypothetical protein
MLLVKYETTKTENSRGKDNMKEGGKVHGSKKLMSAEPILERKESSQALRVPSGGY